VDKDSEQGHLVGLAVVEVEQVHQEVMLHQTVLLVVMVE
jgi:hypothetical protein